MMLDNNEKSREQIISELQEIKNKFNTLKTNFETEIENKEKEKLILKKLIYTLKEFIQFQADNPDYEKITQLMLEISGAKYAAFNIFDENGLDFRTVAFSGIRENINKGLYLLGFDIKNKHWKKDPVRTEKIKTKTITKFEKLHELTGNVISKKIILILEKTFDIGETFVVKVSKEDKVLGDFTLLFKNGDTLQNKKFVELNAHQIGLFLDRNKINEIVRANELMLRTITNSANDAILMMDSEGLVSYWNPAAEQIFGYTTAEAIGKNLYTLVMPPRNYNAYHSGFPVFQKTGKSAFIGKTIDFEAIRKNGKEISVQLSLSAIQNDNSWHAVGIIRDITERKKTEETLRNLSQAVEQSPVSILITDTDGNIEYSNPFVTELTGYKADELLGKNPRVFNTGQTSAEEYTQLWETIKSGIKWQGEFLNKKKNGELYWENALISPIKNEEGKTVRILAIKEDITQRKIGENKLNESEKRFHSLFDNMTEGVALHELVYNDKKPVNYRIVDVNNEYVSTIGLSREQVVGKLGTEAYGTENPPYFEEYVKVSTSKTPVYFESYFEEMNKYFAISVAPWQKNGFATIFTDITERKQSEEKLKLQNEKLQKINSEKDKFFSIIAHDLKSPFNSILGFSELLESDVNENKFENIVTFATIIKESSHRAVDLLTNLMEWTRSQTGRMNFNPCNFELADLVNKVAVLFSETAQQKSLNISKTFPLKTAVYADMDMISTVLRNLISNAIKFTNSGGEISVVVEDNEVEFIVSVRDNGVGISKNNMAKLFQIDKNYSMPGTQNEKGTGLGLILCKEFVEKHNGKIWVESRENEGSTFWFTIPVINDSAPV